MNPARIAPRWRDTDESILKRFIGVGHIAQRWAAVFICGSHERQQEKKLQRALTTVVRPPVQEDTAFLAMLATGRERLLERFWQPTGQVDGSIASVWTPYDSHVDGRWSHCGIDVASLVRVGDAWRIAGITYTVQRRGCARSPLGPPND